MVLNIGLGVVGIGGLREAQVTYSCTVALVGYCGLYRVDRVWQSGGAGE